MTVDAAAGPVPAVEWDAFVREHRDDLVRIARSRLRHDVCGADAEDVVHEVLLRITRRGYDDLASMRHPGAYLRRAVLNECVTRWRRQRDLAVEELPEPAEDDHAERCVARATVAAVMTRLTPRQRAVISLGYLRGYSDAEIAAALGVEPVTVRTLRRRALERMRTALRADQAPLATGLTGVTRGTRQQRATAPAPRSHSWYAHAAVLANPLPQPGAAVTVPPLSA